MVPRVDRPAAILGTSLPAELVVEFVAVGRRRRGMVGKPAVPGRVSCQRPAVSPTGIVDRGPDLSRRLQRVVQQDAPAPAQLGRICRPRELSGLLAILPAAARLMIVKDLRVFRRNPLQWSQFLIFFGLLALYFSNLRRFSYSVQYVGWVNMISFLNLAVVGLLLSTFTTRFIFPMISLEGRRFWILGLLPVRRDTILWSKFLFATGGAILPCSGLVLLSDVMLKVPSEILWSHQLTCVVLCMGLSGIALGLGARLPNLREQSPSRISAGFGGTLNLVLSTLYILVVVLLTALPTHFYLAAHYPGVAMQINAAARPVQWWLKLWLLGGTAGSVLLGALATWVPMRLGCRAFRQLEF